MDIIAIPETTPKIKEGFQGQRSCILPQTKRKQCASHVFCKKLFITDMGYYPNAAFHNRKRVHGCNQHILIYCTKGEGWFIINSKRYIVKPNYYFILPKGIMHEYGADIKTPWSIYWVHFTGDTADYYTRYLQTKEGYAPSIAAPSPTRIMLFDEMLQHLELMNNTDNLIYANSSLYAFLASFKRVHFKTENKNENPIQEIIDLMKNNLDKNFTLEELAKHVHMSPSHLSTLFREKTKYSPINLFTSLKIQKAGQLLMDSDQKIKTIAHTLGYIDPYHFSRVFKNTMGVSPKNFKERAK
ncbi:AraC family transcriptional regulator [Flavihumibacter sp. UBA7668]|uniref:AraC family transcriptional regulator n=1 Tax=Flavihumibacter sp. UBA7668 TaxID=1946542 RepID=UPI0025C616FE|nr:AraC family transcriptional regulator [Flavihumibacter sp. UBA7668]